MNPMWNGLPRLFAEQFRRGFLYFASSQRGGREAGPLQVHFPEFVFNGLVVDRLVVFDDPNGNCALFVVSALRHYR